MTKITNRKPTNLPKNIATLPIVFPLLRLMVLRVCLTQYTQEKIKQKNKKGRKIREKRKKKVRKKVVHYVNKEMLV